MVHAWNLIKKEKTRSGENGHLFWLTGFKVENLIECYFIHRSWSTCTFMTISCTQKSRTWTSEFDTEWSFTWLVQFWGSGRILRMFFAYMYWHMYCLFVFLSLSFSKDCKPLTICGKVILSCYGYIVFPAIAVQGVVVYVVKLSY